MIFLRENVMYSKVLPLRQMKSLMTQSERILSNFTLLLTYFNRTSYTILYYTHLSYTIRTQAILYALKLYYTHSSYTIRTQAILYAPKLYYTHPSYTTRT